LRSSAGAHAREAVLMPTTDPKLGFPKEVASQPVGEPDPGNGNERENEQLSGQDKSLLCR
jgi:hypothetical protein